MRSFNSGLDVYIASRDRPGETLRAIRALQLVDFGVSTRIIVSDNASSPEMVLSNLPEGVLHCIRESCDAQTHFNQIVSELNSEWVLITHDDDEILPALGELFKIARMDSEVNIISGRGRIIDRNGTEVIDQHYESRLRRANLLGDGSVSINNFDQLLFDFGTLFPASAIILKSSLVMEGYELNPDTNYAGDLEYAFSISRGSTVRFRGSEPIMNYHLHGGNSVFNSELPFVLPSQTLICRISELLVNPSLFNSSRLIRLKRDLLRAAILAYESGEVEQFTTLMKYVNEFEKSREVRISSFFVRLLFKIRELGFPLRFILRSRRRFFVIHKNSGV